MSSTSSSECECGQYWPYESEYNTNFRNAYGGNPYHPTTGYPLVYYAQAPAPRNLTHRGRDRERGSPNCFVKAFRWYTKEHVPNNRSQSPVAPDMTGFAAWLDFKYDQFLQEHQLGSEMYHVRLKQTFEAGRVPNPPCEPCAEQQQPPENCYLKNKRRAKSSETGVLRQKSNQSCRYIMLPKDNVSRLPSVCCHASNTTVSECAKKNLPKSQSHSNITLVIKSKCGVTSAPCDAKLAPCETKPAPCNAKLAPCDAKLVSCETKPAPCNAKLAPCDAKLVSCETKPAPCNTKLAPCNAKLAPCGTNPAPCDAKLGPTYAAPILHDVKPAPLDSKPSSHGVKQAPCNASLAPSDAGDAKVKPETCQNKTCQRVSSKISIEKIEILTKDKATISRDFGCQFGTEVTTKVNAETQYDVAVPPSISRCSLPSSQSKRVVDSGPIPEKKSQQSTNRVVNDNTLCKPMMPCEFNVGACGCKSFDTVPKKPLSRASSKSSRKNDKSKDNNHVECQCPEEKVVTVDAHTQCVECQCSKQKTVITQLNAQTQYVPPTPSFNNSICECGFKGYMRDIQAPVQSVSVPCSQLSVCTCGRRKKEEPVQTEQVMLKFAHITSQTSSYSIRLGKEVVNEYPFFLRIVCADKL